MERAINPETGEQFVFNEKLGQWIPDINPVEPSLVSPLMEGLTFGWRGELGNVGAQLGRRLAGASPERAAEAGRREEERQRTQLELTRAESPWASLGAEVGGAMVTGAPVYKGLTALGSKMGLGPTTSMIGAGGIEGGVAGAGAAENKAMGAMLGTPFGLMASAGIPALGYAGTAAAKKLWSPFQKMFGSQTAATRVLNERLQQAGITPTMLRAGQRQLGDQATVADITGPTGIGLGQGIIQTDPAGKAVTLARREMGKRAAGSTRRLREDIAEITGVEERLQPSLDAVRARQKAAAGDLYDLAFRQEIPLTPKLEEILKRPPMQRAARKAREAAETVGDEIPKYFDFDEQGVLRETGMVPDMRAWDMMKQQIDDLIEKEVDSITGRMSGEGRRLSILKNQLMEELDNANPYYKQARQIFAGDEAIQNSMREGEKLLTRKTREVSDYVKNLTDSEREAYLTGAVESIREKMGRARSGEIGEFRFLEAGNTKEKLRTIFPPGREGDRKLAEMLRVLNRERTFATTQGQLVGGSQTALRQAAGDALGTGMALPSTTEAIANPMGAAAQAALASARQATARIRPRAADELGRMLFSPNVVEDVIKRMQAPRPLPFVNPLSVGSAQLAPVFGLGAGEFTR